MYTWFYAETEMNSLIIFLYVVIWFRLTSGLMWPYKSVFGCPCFLILLKKINLSLICKQNGSCH